MRKKFLLALLGDLWCAIYHFPNDWDIYGNQGLCRVCDREWNGHLCISRHWSEDMRKLAEEV